jgi:Mg2+-importing ATPase
MWTTPPWGLTPAQVLERLGSSPTGLDAAEAARRLVEDGPNAVARNQRHHGWRILLSQFTSPLILVLIGAAIVSRYLGESVEATVIMGIVVVNAALGFVQEYRAERALRALQRFVTHSATVRRAGTLADVPFQDLVAGDVVCLEIGDVVPADVRLLVTDDLSSDESTLTGESIPVAKRVEPVSAGAVLPHELTNVAFMGTAVSSGYGEGVVIATGARTLFGRSATTAEQRPRETEFQRSIRRFSDLLLVVILAMTVFVFVANALLGKGLFDSLLFAIALAVGITPEVLPVIVTIALSNGALRMAREKVVTRRLMSVEDLGNVDTLCCDKTGTLTAGTVSLHDYLDLEGARDPDLVRTALLCTSGAASSGTAGANALDRAVWRSETAQRLQPTLDRSHVVDRNEFDFERRRMSALVRDGDRATLLVKGSPEAVLAVSTSARRGRGVEPMTPTRTVELQRRITEYEEQGYRVLALAHKEVSQRETSRADETNLVLLGFLLFLDPAKPEAGDSLRLLEKLGVDIKVMSGDSPVVTRRICRDVGLPIALDRVITGTELTTLDMDRLGEVVRNHNVFARVTPEQKYRLVERLSAGGHVVGFLGDGVNDVPALKAADVGICVDSGADIAKDAADIILLRKSLRVLAQGIVEGRKTFSNITKYVLNTVSANFGNMVTVALSSLFLAFIPLLPSQILLTNLVSDLPLVTISTDNVDADLLERPRRWDLALIARFMVGFGLLSVLFDLLLIGGLLYLMRADAGLFRTAWFVESACSEILVTFAIRTRRPFFRSRPGRWLLLASAATGVVAFVLPFTAIGRAYFAFTPLPASLLLFIGGILGAYFFAAEIAKRRYYRLPERAARLSARASSASQP